MKGGKDCLPSKLKALIKKRKCDDDEQYADTKISTSYSKVTPVLPQHPSRDPLEEIMMVLGGIQASAPASSCHTQLEV